MSDDVRHQLGAWGEQLAAEHLERLGYAIVARNVRARTGELDIVATDAKTIVFCEVKTRRAGVATSVFEGLRQDQRRRIRAMAVSWLSEAAPHLRRDSIRFDAIGVLIDATGRLVSLEHLEGCF
jgi:putative endonuclease